MTRRNGSKKNYIKDLKNVTKFQLESYNIDTEFPEQINQLSEYRLIPNTCKSRKDFRGEKAFTIDCKSCKDMDDAVSILKTGTGYRLAVHIADVSAYVPVRSELDTIAISRATSIYLPNMTIPMLPPILSNNLCSLNQNKERLTLSVIMKLDEQGNVVKTEITKGIIRSRVKGVYAEVNNLLFGSKDSHLLDKYADVKKEIFIMRDLYEVLRSNRIKRGATVQDDNRPLISIGRDEVMITPVKEGYAENMIEEFMILANNVVAEYLYKNDLPAIFRIQDERNHLAAYRTQKLHHAELMLENYSHFTSPIRRIADLKIHQIISMHLDGASSRDIHKCFDYLLPEICERATRRSRTAKSIEDKCRNYCYEQYFKRNRNTKYTGKVTGFNRKNEPVIVIDKYNIRVIGDKMINLAVGEELSFNVCLDNKDRQLKICDMQRKVA